MTPDTSNRSLLTRQVSSSDPTRPQETEPEAAGTIELNVLLVDADRWRAHRTFQAVAERGIAQPVHVASGEAAVDWVRRRACDLCILVEPMAAVDKVPVVTLLRELHPFLSIVVVPDETAGPATGRRLPTVTQLPTGGQDVPGMLGRLLEHWSRRPAIAVPNRLQTTDGLLASLTPPTLQNRLRIIGWQLDRQPIQTLSLWQVNDGFLARVTLGGQSTPVIQEYPDWQYLDNLRRAIGARGQVRPSAGPAAWLPSTYEDVLRAIGYWLDGEQVINVAITQSHNRLTIIGDRATSGSGTVPTIDRDLDHAGLVSFLTEAVGRRR